MPSISINSEFIKNGKPVEIYTVIKDDLLFYEKTTVNFKGDTFYSLVSRDLRDKIKLNLSAVVFGEEDSKFKAIVTDVANKRDLDTGLFLVQLKIEDSLRPKENSKNLFALINIKSVTNILLVPTNSIIDESSSKYVWVVDEGKSVRREVKTGESSNGQTHILSGLSVGDKVITRGKSSIGVNQKIRIVSSLGEIK